MNTEEFSNTYLESKNKFLTFSSSLGLEIWNIPHPLTGAEGEALSTDVVRIGSPEAENIFILESGLHGAEGFAGAAIQCAVLADANFQTMPENTALILVHAINPWGFSWNRRVNEDNIDLNRHFIDWQNPGDLSNPGYEAIAAHVIPKSLSAEDVESSDAALDDFRKNNGVVMYRNAIKRGQYSHPDGIHYGGVKPSWTAKTVQAIADRYLADARRAALIDVHTGLGPFGYGECLASSAPDSPEGQRAGSWYGEIAYTYNPDTGYAGSSSSILHGYRRAAPNPEWTAIGLEYGTRDSDVVRNAVRFDGWLHLNGSRDNPAWDEVKGYISNAFNPSEPEWQRAVVSRGLEVVRHGLTGISAKS